MFVLKLDDSFVKVYYKSKRNPVGDGSTAEIVSVVDHIYFLTELRHATIFDNIHKIFDLFSSDLTTVEKIALNQTETLQVVLRPHGKTKTLKEQYEV